MRHPPPKSTLFPYTTLFRSTKIEELDVVVRKAAEKGQLLRDNVALRAHAPGAEPFAGLLTRSARMQDVLRIVERVAPDRKSTRLNSSHSSISYAVFCLKKKK